MSLDLTCPLPAAIPDLANVACSLHFGQIVRFALKRIGTPFVDITLETEWDTKLAALDSTKVVLSPLCEGATISKSESAQEGGNDNTTTFGLPELVGENNVQVAGMFRGLPIAMINALKSYESEGAIYGKLGVILINEFGKVLHNNLEGFPIKSFFVSSPGSEGFNTNNSNDFSWWFRSTWATNLTVSTPDFDIIAKPTAGGEV